MSFKIERGQPPATRKGGTFACRLDQEGGCSAARRLADWVAERRFECVALQAEDRRPEAGRISTMRRFGRVVAVLALTVLAAIDVRVRAQSAADFAQTAAYAAAQQNADGGFAASPGQPSTLGDTNT